MLFLALFNKKLIETFRWREPRIEEIEEILPNSNKNSAEDK